VLAHAQLAADLLIGQPIRRVGEDRQLALVEFGLCRDRAACDECGVRLEDPSR
jgi:hypothetical protein